MYAPRTICSRCASRLQPAVTVRRSAAARFSSPAEPSPSEHEGGDRHGTIPRRGSHRNSFGGQRCSKTMQRSAVALFNDIVNKTEAHPPVAHRGLAPNAAHPPSLGEWEIAARMKELLDRRAGSPEELRLFRTDIWPHVAEMRGQMPKHLYLATTQFLSRACDAVADEGEAGNTVELSSMCARVGKWDLDLRNELVLSLCHELIGSRHSSAKRTALVDELVGLWQHISQLRRKSQGDGGELRFVLPTVEEVFGDAGAEPPEPRPSGMAPTTKALASIFVQFRLEQSRDLIPGLLATVAILSDPRLARHAAQVKTAPLLNLVAAALERGGADQRYVDDAFGGKTRYPPAKLREVRAYVVEQWPRAEAMLSGASGASWRQGLDDARPAASPAGLASFSRQLRAAYRARNTGAIVSVWQDLKARLGRKPDLVRQMRDDPEFLDFWIFAWCAVRRPAKLQETLDLMREVRVQPTVKTYTSMMHGWKICKDGDKIAALWDKLVESGLRLDAVIWTERISALIEAGRPQAGIEALAEMMTLWKRALAKAGPDAAARVAVQPNIEVVNAAFKGLVHLDLQAANEVLAWAGREGIEPNIRTFNILLRESFRGDGPDDVPSLLRTMKRRGIEPDAATFTIILEEVLGVLDRASAAEQVQAVHQIVADIEASGLRANLETYGKMLYAVASLANGGADEAVAAVLGHMRAAGLTPTRHIVTILIERALARDPPSPGAVKALLREHKLTSINQGDQTLWERVTSAHAVTGDVESAMAVFGDLARAGRPVTSLPCLADLLSALLEADRLEDARGVVGVVIGHKLERDAAGGVEVERDARYWRHHFWYVANQHGLLDGDDVPAELQSRFRAQDR
ncbi:glutathione S-transferase [Drechmeria coniospora]|uniref:Glutathione S-transferase n=1 Tax=Drechmeria coniospora TaxID=98403 RepID=A0A151GXT7_DRECN|nr:glutathione S-transferase [Drechmeria coniospora]KYK61863.1 glutathione S-transferase [Drechmeria coniospora]